LVNYHGIRVREKSKATSEAAEEVDHDVDDNEPEHPDHMDASKEWGYMAREEGRYGSYPMHDDYSDEAEP